MTKPQYTLSYNRSRSSANWVAWRLDSSWIGSTGRVGDFAPDETLPAGWYRVTPADYVNPAYDRGHMTPSGDRTRTIPDNEATFLMTNILPQLDANNQGPWADFENYCRSLAQTGNEIYIVSGGVGNIGTIAQGRLVVPEYTWKVVLIIGNGDFDLSRITKRTRTIGLIIPNQGPITSNAWRNYRVSVNQVEALTGYNFYSNIPNRLQETIEGRIDTK
jgi:endonuclease G